MRASLFSVVLVLLGVGVFSFGNQRVDALSCLPLGDSTIGTVSEVVIDADYNRNRGRTQFAFERKEVGVNHEDFSQDQDIYNLDLYHERVLQYIHEPGVNSREIPHQYFPSFPGSFDIANGDIAIFGPPRNIGGCGGYSVTAIFSPDGKPKYIYIRDTFFDYTYNGEEIRVKPGKSDTVIFNIADEKFSLSADQSYQTENSFILGVTLVRAWYSGVPDVWGEIGSAEYVLFFSEPAQEETFPGIQVGTDIRPFRLGILSRISLFLNNVLGWLDRVF